MSRYGSNRNTPMARGYADGKGQGKTVTDEDMKKIINGKWMVPVDATDGSKGTAVVDKTLR